MLVLLQPALVMAGAEATRMDADAFGPARGISVDLLFPGFVSAAALLAASLLGTLKPWGRTPYRRRRSAAPGQMPSPRP